MSFAPSKVYVNHDESNRPPPSYRTSSTSVLPSNDPIVSIIRDRALSVVGFLPSSGIEALQLVRYGESERFAIHYDWFEGPVLDSSRMRYNRLASFFLYLDANCTSGETYFPQLPAPPRDLDDGRFLTTANRTGLAIVPRVGSGVFWMNLHGNGTGDTRTLHTGMPVRKGTKTAMNIWIKAEV